jgi:hypothetical protein
MAKKQIVGKECCTCWCDCTQGNREERGGHHAAISTDLSVKHTEEIKVMQPPSKRIYVRS